MAKLKEGKWALVRHSGYTKPGFAHAVEEAALGTDAEVKKVKAAGGAVYDTYLEASDAAERENYPPGVEGFYPEARGVFRALSIGGRAIYVAPGAATTHLPQEGTNETQEDSDRKE